MSRRPPKRRTGRPPSLRTKAARKKVLDVLRQGGSKVDAALAAGASYQTLHNEALRDTGFAADIEQAINQGKTDLIKAVYTGAKKDPRLALSILARRFPMEWGEKKNDTPREVNVNVTGQLTFEERRMRLAAIAVRVGAESVVDEPALEGPGSDLATTDDASLGERESGVEPI